MRRKIIAALPCGTRGRTALLSCKPEPEKELRYPMYYLFAGGLQPQSCLLYTSPSPRDRG